MFQRLKNLWRLSEFEPHKPTEENKVPGTIVSMIMKRPPQKAQFIPRIKEKPIDKITKIGESNA